MKMIQEDRTLEMLYYLHCFYKLSFFWKVFVFGKVHFWSYDLPTVRVGRSVTRLTVYWAFPLRKETTDKWPRLDKVALAVGCA